MTQNLYCADFETLVLPNVEQQTKTWTWSCAFARLFSDSEDVTVLGNIADFIDYFFKLRNKLTIIYFHNLKFDASYIIDYLLKHNYNVKNPNIKNSDMAPFSFKVLISSKNRMYSLTIKTKYGIIEFRDSAKLIPFSLRDAGKAFDCKHQKLEMDYVGYREENCKISQKDYLYIRNDVLVLKEILEHFLSLGHDGLTIGSCCLKEFKKCFDREEFSALFPRLDLQPCPFFALNTDEYVRRFYKGAWCYLKKEGTYHKGKTYDVNGLYSYVMHSMSGNSYPVGNARYFEGDIPEKVKDKNKYCYFVHVKARFNLKEGFLPTLQIKNSFLYKSNEWLTTSDIFYHGKYYSKVIKDGVEYEAYPELYLTHLDYELFLKHYEVRDLEIIDGCYFHVAQGLFDEYIDHWQYEKSHAKTKVVRTIAKLFLNNLYGKLSMSTDSSYMMPMLDNNAVVYDRVPEFNKKPIHIACGAMITACARYYTITNAQRNYDNFIYADTDSLHIIDEQNGLRIHDKDLGAWKCESDWSTGIFIRQKCYAEFIRKENGEKVNPHWNITCAGLPDKGKKQFLQTHPITDFKYGLHLPKCKLTPKIIEGGMILVETDYTMYKKY